MKNQLKIELAHVARLRKHIRTCHDKSDFGSKEILDKILEETEDSVDWIETQFNRIKDIGIKNYMMENMSKDNNWKNKFVLSAPFHLLPGWKGFLFLSFIAFPANTEQFHPMTF